MGGKPGRSGTKSGGAKPRVKPRNRNAKPVTEEEVYATYLTIQSYTETAERFRMPLSTVFGIVKRLGGDALVDHRNAMRADLARKIWANIGELVAVVKPSNLGTEKSSQGFEAARSADSLARVAGGLEPKGEEDKGNPPVINVFTGVAPPAEVIAAQESTATDKRGT